MKKVTNIYSFEAIESIKQGKVVYCCDKIAAEVFKFNNLPVDEAIHIINNDCQDRYEFWYVEGTEGDAEV
ncbi:MAG: hypothetical protein IKB98_00305 [Clostridia bacterium]|nr:hypothetical protein [Clostridia bacterium]